MIIYSDDVLYLVFTSAKETTRLKKLKQIQDSITYLLYGVVVFNAFIVGFGLA